MTSVRKARCIGIVLAFLTLNPNECPALSNKTVGGGGSVWTEARKITGLLLHSCLNPGSAASSEQVLIVLQDCLKRKSLMVFDRTINREVIELTEGVSLVRYQRGNDARILDLPSGTSKIITNGEDWISQVVDRLMHLCQTHVLKIHLGSLEKSQSQGRGHRHKQSMFTHLMMFALVAAGLIVIPLGFQFLAILGGKALLLAKMALLLSSIQGLKKIATSNLNYGLYSTSYGQGPWHYDRKWPYEIEGHGDTTYSYTGYQHGDLLHPRTD